MKKGVIVIFYFVILIDKLKLVFGCVHKISLVPFWSIYFADISWLEHDYTIPGIPW